MLSADIFLRFRFGVKFFCILLSVCISCHPYIVWNSFSLSSCARCLCFLPVSFVLLDVSAGSSSRPPCAPFVSPLLLPSFLSPFPLWAFSILPPLFHIHFVVTLVISALSLLSLLQSIVLSYLLFSRPSLCLASGQHQLHGVGRADRHERTGWPQPGNSSTAEVSPCALSSKRIALFLFLWLRKRGEVSLKWGTRWRKQFHHGALLWARQSIFQSLCHH